MGERPNRRRRLLFGVVVVASLYAWACSTTPSGGDRNAGPDAARAEAAGDVDSGGPDAPPDHRVPRDASCDARIAACPSGSGADYSTTIDPVVCAAPPYDQYNTGSGVEQVEAGCNDFCAAKNPSFDAAAGTVVCNQTPDEQALGGGAFHCACAPP